MKNTIKKSIIILLLIFTIIGCATPPTYKQGTDAFYKGDYRTSLRAFKPLAEQGNASAQNYLGAMYYNGTVVTPRDYALSAFWFRKAADLGHANAQYNLATMYNEGKGVKKNPSEALNLLRRASEQGQPDAKKALARMQQRNEETSSDNTNWGATLLGIGIGAIILNSIFSSDEGVNAKGNRRSPSCIYPDDRPGLDCHSNY